MEKWVNEGFSEKLLMVDFLHKYREKIPVPISGITKMGLLLARHHFFGERTLSVSTLGGREEFKLNGVVLDQLKKVLRSFTKASDNEFEIEWGKYRTSLTHLCKKLRQYVQKYGLKEKARQLTNYYALQ